MKLDGHIFMIGFMGVGKTSTSRQLSSKLHIKEIDTDALIECQEGRGIPEIFEQSGEEYFRRVESEMIDKLSEEEPCIVSCGGGLAMRRENVVKMKAAGTVVLLTATPETIYEHVRYSTNRPLLNGNMNVPYIRQLMEARETKYREAADLIVETDGLTPEQVADRVIGACNALQNEVEYL